MAYELSTSVALEYGTETDPYFLFISRLRDNIRTARSIAADPSRTFSYRGFHVAGVLAAATPISGLYEEFDSGNTKAQQGKGKVCAEQKLLSLRAASGLVDTIGLVVVGPSARNSISSVLPSARPTLLPCDECTTRLYNDHSVEHSMPIVTTGRDNGLYEVHSVAEVLAYHENPSAHDEVRRSVSVLGENDSEHRARLYLSLYAAEQTIVENDRRTPPQLAQAALLATLPKM